MQKHLLLTIGDAKASSSSLRFVHGFFKNKCDIRLTLFYVAPKKDGWAYDLERGPEQAMLDEIESIKKRHGRQVVDASRDWIVAHGCSLDNVEAKVVQSRGGTVREIIQEGISGMYDAVAVGRRGVSWLEGLVEDSVSQQLLWQEMDFPLWVCRRPPREPAPTVLLCVDGSGAALRMADHVGFMLSDQPEHTVTMLHANNGALRASEIDAAFDSAQAAMAGNGVPEERIGRKVIKTSKPVDAILGEARSEGYGVLAVGRRAGEPSARERLFPGSVSTRLLRAIDDTVLWVSK